jgi:hypothetical protein
VKLLLNTNVCLSWLLVQAKAEAMTDVTHDPVLNQYAVPLLAA